MIPEEHKGKSFIGYEFYSKPMANPIVILNRSAQTEGTKIATMAAELKRRWKNTWEGASTQKYEAITMKFMDNLASMGYPQSWRESTLKKVMIGYRRVLTKVQKGETRRNRLAKYSEINRRYKRLCGQTNWFREDFDENEASETPEHRR